MTQSITPPTKPRRKAPVRASVRREAAAETVVSEAIASEITAPPAPAAAELPFAAEVPAAVIISPEPEVMAIQAESTPEPAPAVVAAGTPSPKETIMSVDLTSIKTAFADLQAKAKESLAKGQAAMADATEFGKGNLEAVVVSSKIAAAGVQEMTGAAIADSKAKFETLTAEAKALAAVKSPAELTLKHFDEAVAAGSKHGETLMKFASDVTAPLTARFSLALEKLQIAA